MKKLEGLLEDIQAAIPYHTLQNDAVSAATVGWHLSHVLLVLQGILEAIKKSDPAEYQWTFNWRRIVILTLKKIPRGRARAPKSAHPKEEISEQSLKHQLSAVKQALQGFEDLTKRHFFVHPFFEKLNKPTTLLFLRIHTDHHLKIVQAIIQLLK
jgi:hypothetical protein